MPGQKSKKSSRGVTFVDTGSDKKAAKRKKKTSGDQEQDASKKQHLESGEHKKVKVPVKEKVQKPISPVVLQHIETLMNTAEFSVVNSKRIVEFAKVQAVVADLKKMLLQHYKKLKFPSTKLENLKSLSKDLADEKLKLEHNQEMLKSLNNEVEKAVENANTIEESTQTLEEKLRSLTQQAEKDAETLGNICNSDPLQLPKATYEADTFQEKVKKLKNPHVVLRELASMEENPAYKGMHKLLVKSFSEISYSKS